MLNSISNPKKLSLYCLVLAVFVISAGTALAQNSPPVADAGEDVNMFFGESVVLHGTATDSNGEPVLNPTWSWRTVPKVRTQRIYAVR
jgi:hypothetical protein